MAAVKAIVVGTNGLRQIIEPTDYLSGNQDAVIRAYQRLGSAMKRITIGQSLANMSTTMTLASQRFELRAVELDISETWQGAWWFQNVVGNYTPSLYNGMGVYSCDVATGILTLQASSTNDGACFSTGANNQYRFKLFSSTYNATPGIYYVAMLYCSSAQVTAPTVGAAPGYVGTNVAAADFSNNLALGFTRTTISLFPATINMPVALYSTVVGSNMIMGLY